MGNPVTLFCFPTDNSRVGIPRAVIKKTKQLKPYNVFKSAIAGFLNPVQEQFLCD